MLYDINVMNGSIVWHKLNSRNDEERMWRALEMRRNKM